MHNDWSGIQYNKQTYLVLAVNKRLSREWCYIDPAVYLCSDVYSECAFNDTCHATVTFLQLFHCQGPIHLVLVFFWPVSGASLLNI